MHGSILHIKYIPVLNEKQEFLLCCWGIYLHELVLPSLDRMADHLYPVMKHVYSDGCDLFQDKFASSTWHEVLVNCLMMKQMYKSYVMTFKLTT